MHTITLELGLLAPSITEQLQGYGFEPTKLARLTSLNDSINRLQAAGLITDPTAHSARKRLLKRACVMLDLPTSKRP
jgi:hypothetical protein